MDQPDLTQPDPRTIERDARLLRPLLAWHRFRVEGMEHVPRTGPCLWVAHHSLATYDGFLTGLVIFQQTGRITRGLGDKRIFQTPWLRGEARRIGIVPASPDAGERLLRQGELVAVAPGGMWESLRPSTERYRTRWEGRRGFCRLALRTGAPMMFSACPRADELYTVYPSRLTEAVYRRMHLPLPIARGLGPTLVPRPVPLVAWLSPLLHPPPWVPAREEEQVDQLHARASAVMAELLNRR